MLAGKAGHTAITGIQFGDEGKGQIVDVLASTHNAVVRYNGGANAGHTVVVGGKKYALHLVPSGILHGGNRNFIANGVVIDPFALVHEMDSLRDGGVEIGPRNLVISNRCHLVLPYHKMEDELLDAAMAHAESSDGSLLGTTKRGIGPCYSDRALRSLAIRTADLVDANLTSRLIKKIVPFKNRMLRVLAEEAGVEFKDIDVQEMLDSVGEIGEKLKPYITDTTVALRDEIADGKRLLFEGANATLLDIDFGTFPFVTSSNCITPAIPVSTGIGNLNLTNSIGVAKTYMSRVGAGPFPTELEGEIADTIRDRAHEYGTSTGRPRRIGWLDLVALKHTVAINGITELVLTGLAFLHGIDPIRVCTAYESNGKRGTNFPPGARELSLVRPVFEELPGFEQPVSGVTDPAKLPGSVTDLVALIEKETGATVAAVCTGKSRDNVLEVASR
ncbi:MAG: adenylosuccinate synthase [Spirochaetota bacterium]